MNAVTERAYYILDAAWSRARPSHAVALFSGGYDSLVSTFVTASWAAARRIPLHVAHINTGIGIGATRTFVRATAQQYNWRYIEYATPAEIYLGMVGGAYAPTIPGGFPGAPLHFLYYCRLKDRRIADLMRALKRHRSERVLLSTGLRQQESRRRMGYNSPITRERARVWVNPLFYAVKDDVLDIRDAAKLPHNSVVDCLHMSGECLCGAMNQPGELAEIRFWYPDAAAYIDQISDLTIAAGFPWAWDAPARVRAPLRAGQTYLDGFAPLCSSCELRAAEAPGNGPVASQEAPGTTKG